MGYNNQTPKISPIYCPFESKIAPQVDEVQEFTNQWARKFNFLPSDEAVHRFSRIKVGVLTNRGYAGADVEMLKLVSCWLSFTFFLDDQAEKIQEPEQLQMFCSRFLSFLQSPTQISCEGKGPLFESLADLWNHSLSQSPSPAWSQRFIKDLNEYLQSNAWEAANKQYNRIPSLAEYIHHRQFTVAVYVYFDLYELAHRIQLPENVPELSQLTRMANNIISWFNDIISLQKELSNNDVHNLVIVIQNEYQCTLQEAMDRAIEMHNIEMKNFLELESLVRSKYCSTTNHSAVEISRYIDGLHSCIRGNVDWSHESGRYLSSESKTEDLVCAYFRPAN
jgi:5-epi-alpha-selinene synthase